MNFLCVHTNKKSVNWFKEITAAWKNSGLEIYELPKTLLSKPETVAGNGSISGLQLHVVDGALRIYDLLYPSHFDRKLYASIVEHLEKGSFGFHYKNEELTNLPQYLSEESFVLKDTRCILERVDRKIKLENLLTLSSTKTSSVQENFLIEKMHHFSTAKTLAVYPIDGLESVIWNGEITWIQGELKQVLFSQKAFDGKLRGVIGIESFQKILQERVIIDDFGVLFPSVDVLGSSDYKALNVQMEQFEAMPKPVKSEALAIAAGKLQEVSYEMTRTIFSGKSLKIYSENLVKEGLSQGQIEVAALAVSAMLEIAATAKGASLVEMTEKLKAKNKLTNEAAHAVAAGFVKAAQEEPLKKSLSKKKMSVIGLVLLVILYLLLR
jgi:hypothetical protein